MSTRYSVSKSTKATFFSALIMALLWATTEFFMQLNQPVLLSAGLFCALTTLTWFDFDHYRIPNWISYPLILSGLLFAYCNPASGFAKHILGAIIGYALIWGLNVYWRQRRGKDGIGMGDAKLLAAAGAWLGIMALPLVTLIASGSALASITFSRVTKEKVPAGDNRIAFGPFIALSFWMLWLVEPTVGLLL